MPIEPFSDIRIAPSVEHSFDDESCLLKQGEILLWMMCLKEGDVLIEFVRLQAEFRIVMRMEGAVEIGCAALTAPFADR